METFCHLFFARDALHDCQIHLEILRSSASALAGGVAQLSAVSVAATIIDAAAAVAAATRSAARAAGTVRLSQNVYSASAQMEEAPVGLAWNLQPSKQFHSQHVWRKQPAKSMDHSQHGNNSYGQQSVLDSGMTVQDLEEGIAGLARSCPSSPLMPFRAASSGKSRKGMHLSSSGGGDGRASLVLVTCGSRPSSMTNGFGQSAQDVDSSSVQYSERGFGAQGVGGAGAEVCQGSGKISRSAGGGGEERGRSDSPLANSGGSLLQSVRQDLLT